MAAVKIYISKFGREVLIEENHPLAIEQRARDSVAASGEHTATHSDDAPSAAATVAHTPAERVLTDPPGASAEDPKWGLRFIMAKLEDKSDDEIIALAKEASLDTEASRDNLIADLAILIDGGLVGFEPAAEARAVKQRKGRGK